MKNDVEENENVLTDDRRLIEDYSPIEAVGKAASSHSEAEGSHD